MINLMDVLRESSPGRHKARTQSPVRVGIPRKVTAKRCAQCRLAADSAQTHTAKSPLLYYVQPFPLDPRNRPKSRASFTAGRGSTSSSIRTSPQQKPFQCLLRGMALCLRALASIGMALTESRVRRC